MAKYFLGAFLLAAFWSHDALAQALTNDSIAVIFRAVERLLAIIAAIVLLWYGFRLLLAKGARSPKAANAGVKINGLGELNLSGYGAGVVCMCLGTGIILFSIFNGLRIDPNTGKILFFDRPADSDEARDFEFLTASRLLKSECNRTAAANVRMAAVCTAMESYREYLLSTRYKARVERFRVLDQKAAKAPSALSDEEMREYIVLKSAIE